MTKAREVLEAYVDKYDIDQLPSQFADWVLSELSEAGYAIVPKEPSEEMMQAARDCDDPSDSALYRAMLLTAQKENGE